MLDDLEVGFHAVNDGLPYQVGDGGDAWDLDMAAKDVLGDEMGTPTYPMEHSGDNRTDDGDEGEEPPAFAEVGAHDTPACDEDEGGKYQLERASFGCFPDYMCHPGKCAGWNEEWVYLWEV